MNKLVQTTIRVYCPRLKNSLRCNCTLKERIQCTKYVPCTYDEDFLIQHGFLRQVEREKESIKSNSKTSPHQFGR